MTTRTRTVAYLRVSTADQADHGVSLAAQREKVEAYAKLYDLDLVAIIEDAGQSAKSLKRPGLEEALGMLDAHKADALLVAKLDRLTRRVPDLGYLIETYFDANGAALLSVAEQVDTRSAAGRLVLHVLGAVSQWERETIGERTREALAHKRRHGKRSGHVPYGWTLDADGATLAEEPEEQAVITEIHRLRGEGWSQRRIVEHLNVTGVPARGKQWYLRTLQLILKRTAA